MTSRYYTVLGMDIHVLESAGAEPALLFLPGGVVDHIDLTWKKVVRRLAETYRVVAPDLPGFGKSRGLPESGYDTEFVRHFALELMDVVGLRRAVVVANSMSGGAAMDMARLDSDRVIALIVSGAYGWQPRVPFHELAFTVANMPFAVKLAKALARRESVVRGGIHLLTHEPDVVDDEFLQDGLDGASAPNVAEAFVGWLRSELGAFRVRTDRRPVLDQILVPTLILQGRHDWLTPERYARQAADRIPGARYVVLDTNHLLPREEPGEAEREIRAFLSAISDISSAGS